LEFHDQCTAGNGIFSSLSGGFGGSVIKFFDSATAANGNFRCAGGLSSGAQGGFVSFTSGSSAANGTYVASGPTALDAYPGTVEFRARHGRHGTFTLNGGTVSGEGGGEVNFFGSSSAGDGLLIVNGSSVSGAAGGDIDFFASSTAGNATIIVNGGQAAGGECPFGDDSLGGTPRVEVFGNGIIIIITRTQPFTLGSIEGDGLISTSRMLQIGGNNLSTLFPGVIQAFGNSPVEKVGTATLTLGGTNTYPAGTTISQGV
jgi:autotransporter-associated beta strand protein